MWWDRKKRRNVADFARKWNLGVADCRIDAGALAKINLDYSSGNVRQRT